MITRSNDPIFLGYVTSHPCVVIRNLGQLPVAKDVGVEIVIVIAVDLRQ